MRGPDIKKDELLHGSSVLDITPTVLALYGLPVGADMDGKVLVGAFAQPPQVETIPSWEEVPGEDGRHPPHTRLDPDGARESLEQLVALGYIAAPNEDRAKAVADTVAELRYNLGEAYQDAGRHAEAVEIFRELHRSNPDEHRHAVHRFVSAQALGLADEMREVVADLDGRRRGLYEQAVARIKELRELGKKRLKERRLLEGGENDAAAAGGGALFSREEEKELARLQELAEFQPALVDYLKAHVKAREGEHAEALGLLQHVQESHLARPGLFLHTGDLYLKLQRWDEAEATYAKALALDPDNPHAHVGMARLALRRRDFEAAAEAALRALERLHHYPMAHFLLGVALTGLGEFERAAVAYRAALGFNPNFPQAHLRLSSLLRARLGDSAADDEHLRLFHELRRQARQARTKTAPPPAVPAGQAAPLPEEQATAVEAVPLPPLGEEVVIVSGLPRSGTSMIMQMLTAGGLAALTDGQRQADADNPRGYFEYEPAKHLHQYAGWLEQAKGKVVKIVAPLLPYLPPIACRVIFIDRNLDEVLASQGEMVAHRGEAIADTPERRARLREQYRRQVRQIKGRFAERPRAHLLILEHGEVMHNPRLAAEKLQRFLGGLNVEAMAGEVKSSLHRQRAKSQQARPIKVEAE